jgi:hypothetical protein
LTGLHARSRSAPGIWRRLTGISSHGPRRGRQGGAEALFDAVQIDIGGAGQHGAGDLGGFHAGQNLVPLSFPQNLHQALVQGAVRIRAPQLGGAVQALA